MDNMFGLGVVLEVEDKATGSLNSVSQALDRTEREARGLSSAINGVGNSLDNTDINSSSQSFSNLAGQLDSVQGKYSQCNGEVSNLSGSMNNASTNTERFSSSLNNIDATGASQSIRGVSGAVDDLGGEFSQCNRQAQELKRTMAQLESAGYNMNLDATTQSFSGMIQQMSNVYGGYSEHSRNARKANQLMFKMIQMNTKSANELASSMQGVAQANMNMWKQTSGGKEVSKMFQNLNGDIKEARLAVVGFNKEKIAISADESEATMKRFRGTVDSTKASLDKMLREGTIDTGLYQTALMQLAQEQRQIETLHSRGFRSIQQYNQELLRLGITTTSQADLQALALERNRWAIDGLAKSMLQRTNSASKYSQVLMKQQTLYGKLSKSTLGWVDALEQASKAGNPTVMTANLQKLGMSGKEVQDTMLAVSNEMMGFGQVMMGLIPLTAIFYATLFGKAREMLPWFDKKLTSVGETWKKVFTPLITLFAKITSVFLSVADAVGKWLIEFRKAHPVISKVIDAFTLLLPAVMLVVGAFSLMKLTQVQLFSQMMLLAGNALKFLAKITPMALIVTSAIAVLGVGISQLWKTNADFRNGVINIWEDIKNKSKQVCDMISKHWSNLSSALGEIGGAMFELLKSIFNIGFTVLGAIFGKGVQDFDSFWDSMLSSADSALTNLVSWLTTQMGNLTKIIQDATTKINDWWSQHGAKVTEIAVQAYERVKGVIVEKLTFLLGVVQSILGVIVDYWNQNKDKIIPIVQELVGAVVGLVQSMQPLIQSVLEIIKGFWEEHGQSILDTITNVYTIITDIITMIAPVIESVFAGITSFLEKHGSTISTIISVVWSFISSFITGILNNIKGVIEGTLTVIGGVIDFFSALFEGDFSGMWEAIKSIFTGALQAIYNGIMLWLNVQFIGSLKTMWTSGVGIVKGMWEGIKNFFSTGVTACYVWVDDLVKGIINFFTNLPTSVGTLVSNLWTLIQQLFTTGCQWVVSIVQTFIQGVITFFTNLATGSTTIFQGLWSLAQSLWNAGVNVCQSLISSLVSGVTSFLSSMVSTASGFFSSLWSTGKTMFSNLLNSVVQYVSQIPGKISSFMGEAISYLKSISLFDIGKDMIQGLINGITNMAGAVAGAIKGVADGAVKKAKSALGIKSPSRVFKQIGAWTSEGMAIGVEQKAPLVANQVQALTDNTIHEVEGVLDVAPKQISPEDFGSIAKGRNGGTVNSNNTTNHYTIEVKVEGGEGVDETVLAEKIMKAIERKQKLKGIMQYA